MTRIRSAGLLAVIAAALVVAPVTADTFDAPNGDRSIVAEASFEFTSGGLAYAGGSDVIWDKLTGTIRISASYSTSTPVTCPGEDPIDSSDDFDASIETSFFADAPASSSTFGSKLSSAMAAWNGQRRHQPTRSLHGQRHRRRPGRDRRLDRARRDRTVGQVPWPQHRRRRGRQPRRAGRPLRGSTGQRQRDIRWRRASGRRRDRQSVVANAPPALRHPTTDPNARFGQALAPPCDDPRMVEYGNGVSEVAGRSGGGGGCTRWMPARRSDKPSTTRSTRSRRCRRAPSSLAS